MIGIVLLVALLMSGGPSDKFEPATAGNSPSANDEAAKANSRIGGVAAKNNNPVSSVVAKATPRQVFASLRTDWGLESPVKRTFVLSTLGNDKLLPGRDAFAINSLVYGLGTGDKIGDLSKQLPSPRDSFASLGSAAAVSFDGSLFATFVAREKTVKIFDTRTGEVKSSLAVDTYARGLTFTVDNKVILIKQDGLLVWDLAKGSYGQISTAIEFGLGHFALRPNGQQIAITSNSAIVVIDISDGRQIASMQAPATTSRAATAFSGCHGIAFSPDGTELAGVFSAGDDAYRIRVWDAQAKLTFDEVIASAVRRTLPSPRLPRRIQWFSDGSGWLVDYRFGINRRLKRTVWLIESGRRRGKSTCLFPNGEFLASRESQKLLVAGSMPSESIRSAVEAFQNSQDAIVAPGKPVQIRVQIDATTTLQPDAISKTLLDRSVATFEALGLRVSPEADLSYIVRFREYAAASSAAQVPSTMTSVALSGFEIQVRWTAEAGKRVLADRHFQLTPRSTQGHNLNATKVRSDHLAAFIGKLDDVRLPYFIARDPGVPRLPLVTVP